MPVKHREKITYSVKDFNHLGTEKSPYLLQHADNPVNWYPWSEEAFAKAEREGKPVFLSIGYSTCHWCHVMAHESFENQEIADILNEYFVSIKVDREERPDLDNIYMKAVVAMTGSGGWPLSVFVTPDKYPFSGGTYFPPESRWGRPGFKEILLAIVEKWKDDRVEILTASRQLKSDLFRSLSEVNESVGLDEKTLHKAYQRFLQMYDKEYGGFGSAPKFPSSHNLSFLLSYWKRTGDARALEIVTNTLDHMSAGGIYDHIGGGFHRYSTDQQWHVPHFEKMLYDQAMISRIYLEVYQATGHEEYAQTAREIFDYVLRDMTDKETGGFYSAEDADSLEDENSKKKIEGAFYVWEKRDLEKILGDDEAIISYIFGVKSGGNVRSDPHGEFKGQNILKRVYSNEQAAEVFKKSVDEVKTVVTDARQKLFTVRAQRPRPHLDDKTLVDWNGLMISSFAFGSRVLDEPKYKDAAEKAGKFILSNLISEDGRLLHRYRDGDAAINGTLADYAYFINGLLDLYEATFDVLYFQKAQALAVDMVKLFSDDVGGGFFFASADAEDLIFRDKDLYDGARPSGNSIAALDIVRLWKMTFDHRWEKMLQQYFDAFSSQIEQSPEGYAQSLIVLDFVLGPSFEVIFSGEIESKKIESMLSALYHEFIPNKVIIHRPLLDEDAKDVIMLSPFVEFQTAEEGDMLAYVCVNRVCKIPTNDIVKFSELIK